MRDIVQNLPADTVIAVETGNEIGVAGLGRQVQVVSLRVLDQVGRGFVSDLVAALDRLSPSDQELIRLAGWEELDRDALALAVGCTANAATKRLNRALDRLGRELGVSDRVRGRFFRRKKVAS